MAKAAKYAAKVVNNNIGYKSPDMEDIISKLPSIESMMDTK